MAYIGNSPANIGNYQIVDDISASFNGVLTTFALTAATQTINPAKSGQLLVSINGVLQEPDDTGTEGFKVSGSNIVFSSAPATSSTFWAVWQGQAVDIGTPSDGVVGTAQMSSAELALTGGLSLGDGLTIQGGITEQQTTKSASFTPSFTEGTMYSCTGTMTITMPTATAGKSFTIIHATATSITWAGTIKWNGGSAPTAGAGIDIYVFVSDGTNWYGMQSGTGFA